MISYLKTLLQLIIPQYLLITVVSTASAFLIINGLQVDFTPLVKAIISLSFAVAAFNIVNMLIDTKLDLINKPARPIPSGKISKKEAFFLSIFFTLISIAIGFTINLKFISILLLFFGLTFLYTSPKLYLKKYFWASFIFGATLYGAIPFLVAFSVSFYSFNWIFFIFFTSLILAISPSKDLEDLKGEKIMGIISTPALIGKTNTLNLIIFFLTLSFFFIFILTISSKINNIFLLGSFFTAIIIIWLTNYFNKYKSGKFTEKVITQSNIVTNCMIAVVSIQIIFALISII